MRPKLSDQLRLFMLDHMFSVKSLKDRWELRSNYFQEKLGQPPWGRNTVVNLGSNLSEGFQLVGRGERGQGGVSSGGKLWELLLVWYINLCLHGTNAVCVAGIKNFIPEPIREALTVTYDNSTLNTESDILVISSPHFSHSTEASTLQSLMSEINIIAETYYSSLGVINIQSKTNWNDNAQIPMLWNMLYDQARKGALIQDRFTIGSATYSLRGLSHFAYAFATVPTQQNIDRTFKPASTSVLRAKSMTGGNYWGRPRKNGIALSMSDFFQIFQNDSTAYPPVENIGLYASNNPELIKRLYFNRTEG